MLVRLGFLRVPSIYLQYICLRDAYENLSFWLIRGIWRVRVRLFHLHSLNLEMKYAFKSLYKNLIQCGYKAEPCCDCIVNWHTNVCVDALKLWYLLASDDSPLMELKRNVNELKLKPLQKLQHIHIHNSADIQYYIMRMTLKNQHVTAKWNAKHFSQLSDCLFSDSFLVAN